MPFAASFDDQDPDKQKQNQADASNGSGASGVNVSGVSTDFSTGVPGQSSNNSQGGAGKPSSSGAKFANIQEYLNANQSQGNEMGQKIAGNVANEADDATTKVQGVAAAAPTVKAYDPTDVYNNVTNLTDAQKAEYNAQKAGYQGPQTIDKIQGFGDAQTAANKAVTDVTNAGNEAGQRTLLRDTYARPQYSNGENSLDQALLQSSPTSKTAFENLNQKYGGLGDLFNTTSTNIGNQLNSNITQGLANQQAINTGDTSAQKALLDPITARAAQANTDNAAQYNAFQNDLKAGDNLSDNELSALGLANGQHLYDLNLSNYFTPNQTQAGVNNVASADERAKYAALTGLINGTPGDQITADGKAINPYSVNTDQLQKDLTASDAAYKAGASQATLKNPLALDPSQFEVSSLRNLGYWTGGSVFSPTLSAQQIRDTILPQADRLSAISDPTYNQKIKSYFQDLLKQYDDQYNYGRVVNPNAAKQAASIPGTETKLG